MKRELIIEGIRVADDTDAFVIAEVGHNHQGNLEQCKELFRKAKECGCSAVKLQKRDNRALFTKEMYDSAYNSENAFAPTYGAHREALEFGRDEYLELKRFCEELGILFFATAFDFKSADFLAELDMPMYKMASGDLKSIPLLKHVARLGRPMIISTGGGSLEDIERAYDAIMPINTQLSVLQCTAAYPVEAKQMNLRVISSLRDRFKDIVIGLSDHQSGIALAPVAFALGARVIEKHFTLNRAMKGTDHAFSLEPVGMGKLVRDLKRSREAMGDGIKRPYDNEFKPLQKMGKKLVAAKDLAAGHVLTASDIMLKSPADGLAPYEFDRLVGKRLVSSVREDDSFTLQHVALGASEPRASETKETPVQAPLSVEELVRAIQMVVFDFDGVFTDNQVYVADDGTESVRCSRSDGLGLDRLRDLGLELLVLSTEVNPVVSVRTNKLKVPCLQGQQDKLQALRDYAGERKIPLSAIAYIGNDINDASCLRSVGLPIVVHDAWPEVAPLARHRTARNGGQGAVREVCDLFTSIRGTDEA